MNLLSVIPVLDIGGAEAVAVTLALDARHRGQSVRLASAGGFRVDDLVAQGVSHHHLPLDTRGARSIARSVRRLRALAQSDRPDLVHAHNVKATLVARLAVGRSARVLTTLHGVPAAELGTAVRILSRTADHVVAVSPHVAGQLVDHGLAPERVSVIENSITPLPSRSRAAARERLGLPAAATVVLCLARMAPQKRHDLLLHAWAALTDTALPDALPPDAVLLLAGDGPTRPEVEAEIARLGLGDRVRMLGARTDPDWLLAAADLSVLPTDWEGMPISMLEAMAAGVPVLVSEVGGVIETLGEAVHLVAPGSVDALARGLARLVHDPVERDRLGARGQALVRRDHGPARMLDAYAELYPHLSARPGRVRA